MNAASDCLRLMPYLDEKFVRDQRVRFAATTGKLLDAAVDLFPKRGIISPLEFPF